jgi:uncharacterized protein YaeQ
MQVSDMDRQYYATHALTQAQHPSETDERLIRFKQRATKPNNRSSPEI